MGGKRELNGGEGILVGVGVLHVLVLITALIVVNVGSIHLRAFPGHLCFTLVVHVWFQFPCRKVLVSGDVECDNLADSDGFPWAVDYHLGRIKVEEQECSPRLDI